MFILFVFYSYFFQGLCFISISYRNNSSGHYKFDFALYKYIQQTFYCTNKSLQILIRRMLDGMNIMVNDCCPLD